MLTVNKADKIDWKNIPLMDCMYGNALDAFATHKVYEHLKTKLSTDQHIINEFLMSPLMNVFAKMELRGLLIDTNRLKELGSEILQDIAGLEDTLCLLLPETFNKNLASTKDIAYLLYDKLNLPQVEVTAKGAPSTSASTLEKLQMIATENGNTRASLWIETLLQLKELKKLSTTYINGLADALSYTKNGRVYYNLYMTGTKTGRLSCAMYKAEKPMGVSFHTLPRNTKRNIRELVVADPGKVFITADYSSMELRVMAHRCHDVNMKQAFIDNRDLHTYAASMLYGIDESKITKQQRQIAKAVSFLIIYGGGPFTLAKNHNLDPKVARKLINTYYSVFPGVKSYIDICRQEVSSLGKIHTELGRVRNLPEAFSEDLKVAEKATRQGLNFTIQSYASDIMLCAILGLDKKFSQTNNEVNLLATVHDSIEAECTIDRLKDTLEIIYDEMVNANELQSIFGKKLSVPLAIEVEVGSSFAGGVTVEYDELGKVTNLEEIFKHVNDKRKN